MPHSRVENQPTSGKGRPANCLGPALLPQGTRKPKHNKWKPQRANWRYVSQLLGCRPYVEVGMLWPPIAETQSLLMQGPGMPDAAPLDAHSTSNNIPFR